MAWTQVLALASAGVLMAIGIYYVAVLEPAVDSERPSDTRALLIATIHLVMAWMLILGGAILASAKLQDLLRHLSN